jgi:segregation and condensation protein B
MAVENLKNIIEALIFTSDKPVSLDKLKEIIEEANEQDILNEIQQLKKEYQNRAFSLEEIAGGYIFLTKKEFSPWITKFHQIKEKERLSSAALEVLSIIAYKQPIKRSEIERIRGVSSDHIIKALLERGLIKITGREPTPGGPLLYATTDEFLNVLGIKGLEELPKPTEISKDLK